MLDLPTPEEDATDLLGIARQKAARRFPVQMTATAETEAVCSLIEAVRSRRLDDHGAMLGYLCDTYRTHPDEHETLADLYALIAEDALRLEKNERAMVEDEEPDHEADETFMLHAGFRRAG